MELGMGTVGAGINMSAEGGCTTLDNGLHGLLMIGWYPGCELLLVGWSMLTKDGSQGYHGVSAEVVARSAILVDE